MLRAVDFEVEAPRPSSLSLIRLGLVAGDVGVKKREPGDRIERNWGSRGRATLRRSASTSFLCSLSASSATAEIVVRPSPGRCIAARTR